MSKTFVSGGGDKVKLYVALLPLGDRSEPRPTIIFITSRLIPKGATQISVSYFSEAGSVAAGTTLHFESSLGNGKTATITLSKDTKHGDTLLNIEPAEKEISLESNEIFLTFFNPYVRLLGGTQMSVATNAERTETMVFEDPLGYSDGVVTKQSWNIPWTANLLADDEAYRRVFYANVNAVSGREVYIWQQDPPPAGYNIGDELKGVAVVTNFTKEMPSDGIVTFNCEFTGNGAPTFNRYKKQQEF